jgi:hypothetical protein
VRRLAVLALIAAPLAAQTPQDSGRVAPDKATTVIQAPAERYKAAWLQRFFLGADYRQLWITPSTVEVLDLDHFGGGLQPLGRTGGQETKGLRLGTPDGRQYFFRSIDKDPSLALPPELRGTVANWIVQDQISSANPMAPLVVGRLMDATSILHNVPRVVVLPDSPRLGEFRPVFAGLMGVLEERVGGSGPAAHWHGATEIITSDTLFVRADRSDDDQVDARAFLLARLFDVYIGDWDRHRDQWRWARYDDAVPRRWRPVPLDRDQAFVRFDGFLLGVARPNLPQLVNYKGSYANMAGPVLEQRLRERRDHLLEATDKFYRMLAAQVDIHGTDQADVASVSRTPDGSVTVSLTRASAGAKAPYFTRRFEDGETHDIRVFLGLGDDTATVRGDGGGGITVRILGDSGADQLVDSSGSGSNRYYDSDGPAEHTEGQASKIDRRPYVLPPKKSPTELPPRDWGTRWTPATWASFGPDVGLFIGAVRFQTFYGFRKLPFSSRHRFRAGIATGTWTGRVDYLGEFHRENSRIGFTLFAGASGIEVVRFHGIGNETSASGDDEYYRITQQQYGLVPAIMLPVGSRGTLLLGPTLKYVFTDDHPDRYLATVNPYGEGKFGELGLRMLLRFDTRDRTNAATRGVYLEFGGAVHPPWWDVKETFGETYALAETFLTPKGAPLSPTLALRAGGKRVWGVYPFFDAASIGGVSTVRLGRENRYSGDASAYGSAELRLALFHATLVLPADFGIFGLADVGRVFVKGESSDQWHSAFGGGIWLAFLNRANTLSAAVAASDERTKLYIRAGFGF